ncbi:MAG: DNA polymerase III subunit beta [Synergistaceae bacterium]|nr:DNA polymerase III subunit beta [Synergistaceae bacterium]
MKLELKRQDFLKAWQIAERFIDVKPAKNSLGGILIRASEDGSVTLEATDLKTSVKCTAEGVNIISPGVAVVPAVLLGSMIKKSASEDLILEVNSERGFLNAGNSKTRFAVFSAEEFPKIPESSGAEKICDLLASDLARIIAEGGSASSLPQDFPKYMGTCLLRTQDGYLKGVSTDGKRLALSKIVCGSIAKDDDILLPAAAIKDLGKTLTSSYSDKLVNIFADSSTAWFNLEGVEFSIRRIEAAFPVYERILNDNVKTSMKISSAELASVLDRIDIIARAIPSHIMSMSLNPNGTLKITARAPEKGTASENLTAEISGEPMQIGFNVAYFLDGLKVLGPGEVLIEFSDEEGQSRMKRSESDDLLYMLMPARLSAQDKIAEEEMGEFENDYNQVHEENAPENEDENINQENQEENYSEN